MQSINTLYIDNPEFCKMYEMNKKTYMLVGKICPEKAFFCEAIQLNESWGVETYNKKAHLITLKVIRK